MLCAIIERKKIHTCIEIVVSIFVIREQTARYYFLLSLRDISLFY